MRLTPDGATFARGYRHIDMGAGAAKQNDRRPEPVTDAVSDFLVRNTATTAAVTVARVAASS